MMSNPYLDHKLVTDRQAEIRRAVQQSRRQVQPGQARVLVQWTVGRVSNMFSKRVARLPQASRTKGAYI